MPLHGGMGPYTAEQRKGLSLREFLGQIVVDDVDAICRATVEWVVAEI